jgi:hypothetical protein
VNLLLAIPTAGSPSAPFLASLIDLQMPVATTAFDRIVISGNFIPGQRELAARRAVALNADVLAMFDDDMIVPPNALKALVGALDADPRLAVVGGLYYSRDGIHPMVADRWTSGDTTRATIPAFNDALTYCDVVGFGCVALRVEALRTLDSPYFNCQVYVEEGANRVRICNEDYLLCQDLRRAGWRVALHAGLRCKHFDRTTSVAQPREWESAAQTGAERMIVVDPGPAYRLVPFDATAPVHPERHAPAYVDYIIVE